MKREEVKSKISGITDEQLDWLMGENGRDVTAEKARNSGLLEQVNDLTQQLTAAKDRLKAFDGVDIDDLKEQIAKLQGQLTEQADAFAFNSALDTAIRNAKGRDVNAIRGMPCYNGQKITGRVTRARRVTDRTDKTWEWYVCVQLDRAQTPDAVNYLYFCHCAKLLVSVGQKVKSGDALAVMGNTGNAALADPPYTHCHFEVRATATGKGLDPTAYAGCPNAVGVYGNAPESDGTDETLIDVSYHQGSIDWTQVPYRAILRIGYRGYGSGKLCEDTQLTANLAGSRANGKLYGFYFFSQAITEAEARAEAEFCASLVPTCYPLFFDAEWSNTSHSGRADNLSKAQRTAVARAFCERAKALGFTPGVYTFTAFAQSNIDYEGMCADYTGWLADTRTDYNKTLPRSIHQYGQGSVAGIKGDVDMDRVVASRTVDKPQADKLQVITIGPVSQGDADAVYLLCKQRGLTDAGLYKSAWAEV